MEGEGKGVSAGERASGGGQTANGGRKAKQPFSTGREHSDGHGAFLFDSHPLDAV